LRLIGRRRQRVGPEVADELLREPLGHDVDNPAIDLVDHWPRRARRCHDAEKALNVEAGDALFFQRWNGGIAFHALMCGDRQDLQVLFARLRACKDRIGERVIEAAGLQAVQHVR